MVTEYNLTFRKGIVATILAVIRVGKFRSEQPFLNYFPTAATKKIKQLNSF